MSTCPRSKAHGLVKKCCYATSVSMTRGTLCPRSKYRLCNQRVTGFFSKIIHAKPSITGISRNKRFVSQCFWQRHLHPIILAHVKPNSITISHMFAI